MNYPEEILRQVKQFGFLQYGIDKILTILNPEDHEGFTNDITDDETSLCIMYQSGLNSGQYNLDVVEFKLKSAEAAKATAEVEQGKHLHTMKNDFCGITDDN